jgi:hypothetical protein
MDEQVQYIENEMNKTIGVLQKMENKMQIVVNKKVFEISDANNIYREAAKSGFESLKENLVSFKRFGLFKLEKQGPAFIRANKDNISRISSAQETFKMGQTSQQQLGETYVNSVENLTQVAVSAKQELTTELNDNIQLGLTKH